MNNLQSTPNFGPLANLRANSVDSTGATVATPVAADISTVGDPGDSVKLSSFGDRLAQSTLNEAATNDNLKRTRCYHFVKRGLAQEGVIVGGKHAYLAANQLAKNDQFKEVKVKPSELSELPAGAVVVWNKGGKHKSGHISVSLGDGREISDRIRNQTEGYGTSVRVFLPQDTQVASQPAQQQMLVASR